MVDESGIPSDEDLTLEPSVLVTKPRRRALWGVLAVLAVVAGALAITSGSDDGGPPLLPVALGSSSGQEAAGASMSSDMRIAWVTYVAGEGLPALGGEARAYRLDGAVDEGRVRALADAVGITGDPTHEEGLWHLESEGAVLEVYEDGGGGWWYSANQGVTVSGGGSVGSSGAGVCEPGPATDCAFAETGTAVPATSSPDDVCANDGSGCATEPPTTECPPDAKCVEPSVPVGDPCPPEAICTVPEPIEPAPPADLPSQDEARQIALDLLAAAGMDLGDAKVTVDGPYDAWYVTIEPRLDGVAVTGWLASVGVGSKGAIASASGTLATPEPLGDYPLIDTRAAIDRLNELQGGFGGGPVPMGAPDGVARDTGVATAEAPAPAEPCRSDDPSCSSLVDPTTTIVSQCKVQPDGSEICESFGGDPGTVECLGAPAVEPGADPANQSVSGCPEPPVCYEAFAPPAAGDAGDDVTTDSVASPECGEPIPYPEPEPIEITLTDAERVLTLLPSFDGSGDAYLVPGYRFSGEDGAIAEVAAVADDSLAPTTTVPDTTVPTEPPDQAEPIVLEPGQTPELGVGYYVEVIAHCAVIADFDGRWWSGDDSAGDLQADSGSFTLTTEDEGTFSTASNYTLVFSAQGPAEQYPGCG